jgi:hypothetical protein
VRDQDVDLLLSAWKAAGEDIIALEATVAFQRLSGGYDWFELAEAEWRRRNHNSRQRGQRWYDNRRGDLAWKEERNRKARENAAERLRADEELERAKQKEHRQRWWEKLKADPVRWAEYKRKRAERNRKRYDKVIPTQNLLKKAKPDEDQKYCECGCGTIIQVYDKLGRGPKRFVRGHVFKVFQNRGGRTRKSRKLYMSIAAATRIAGSLSRTTKMPGFSYGLDAFSCIKGSELAKIPGSTCRDCYARRDIYLWDNVKKAHAKRMQAITHPEWEEAMIELISHHCRKEPWFRWHDSGDLMSLEHLRRVIRVCEATPDIHHWMPTREYGFVREFLQEGGQIPPNLAIRLSAYMIGKKAGARGILSDLPTSTVHTSTGAPIPHKRRRDSIECRAYTRDNQCGSCRACWSPRVKNISYPQH